MSLPHALRAAAAAAALAITALSLVLPGCYAAVDDCPKGLKDCGDVCALVKADPKHCGDCDTACAKKEVCQAGVCVLPCDFNSQRRCNGVCIDTFNDANNCGGCGITCDPQQPTCFAGECRN